MSGDSEVLFGVFESPGGSGVGNGPASGDGSGAGSSKAGRAWCQGASVLRGGREAALPGRLSPGWDAAGRPTEPSDALRDRRGPAGGPGCVRGDAEPSLALRARRGSAEVGGDPGWVADGSGAVAADSESVVGDPGSVADGSGWVADGWEPVADGWEPVVVAAGSASVAWAPVPEVVDSGSVDVWLAEPSAAVRVGRGAAGDSEGVSPVVA
ncbi:hypothetical protein [Streptomyces swartbergensis]|uniref:hypothetical protein n=1 Tax=Streptomyces swartbergensis TaxID=487165 RepID=UPI001181411D|nr:hypothetical protein [Streptomyces swartbergensis]